MKILACIDVKENFSRTKFGERFCDWAEQTAANLFRGCLAEANNFGYDFTANNKRYEVKATWGQASRLVYPSCLTGNRGKAHKEKGTWHSILDEADAIGADFILVRHYKGKAYFVHYSHEEAVANNWRLGLKVADIRTYHKESE